METPPPVLVIIGPPPPLPAASGGVGVATVSEWADESVSNFLW